MLKRDYAVSKCEYITVKGSDNELSIRSENLNVFSVKSNVRTQVRQNDKLNSESDSIVADTITVNQPIQEFIRITGLFLPTNMNVKDIDDLYYVCRTAKQMEITDANIAKIIDWYIQNKIATSYSMPQDAIIKVYELTRELIPLPNDASVKIAYEIVQQLIRTCDGTKMNFEWYTIIILDLTKSFSHELFHNIVRSFYDKFALGDVIQILPRFQTNAVMEFLSVMKVSTGERYNDSKNLLLTPDEVIRLYKIVSSVLFSGYTGKPDHMKEAVRHILGDLIPVCDEQILKTIQNELTSDLVAHRDQICSSDYAYCANYPSIEAAITRIHGIGFHSYNDVRNYVKILHQTYTHD
jgi:hypothetical protein